MAAVNVQYLQDFLGDLERLDNLGTILEWVLDEHHRPREERLKKRVSPVNNETNTAYNMTQTT